MGLWGVMGVMGGYGAVMGGMGGYGGYGGPNLDPPHLSQLRLDNKKSISF